MKKWTGIGVLKYIPVVKSVVRWVEQKYFKESENNITPIDEQNNIENTIVIKITAAMELFKADVLSKLQIKDDSESIKSELVAQLKAVEVAIIKEINANGGDDHVKKFVIERLEQIQGEINIKGSGVKSKLEKLKQEIIDLKRIPPKDNKQNEDIKKDSNLKE